MTKFTFYPCIWVSLGVAVVAAFLSSTILVFPAEGTLFPDLVAVDVSILESGSETEVNQHLSSIPMRELSGFERFVYPFTHPQIWYFWGQAFITWFVGLFVATVSVSYLNAKST